ncbi:hypothetical protein [Azospirillum halopraeferens]|uniref:hypothetical protein n=1 Tax=Azospirillum halopraeferens TaxID=34010 RepID=UPI00041B4A98|nr:hypothetical protein [Azospirillum halopraeferens]
MRTVLVLALAGFLAVAPAVTRAQDVPAQVPLQAPVENGVAAGPSIFGLAPEHALSVGIGIVAGALAMDMLAGRGSLIGAIAGGLIGSWWYGTHEAGPRAARVNRIAYEPAPAI